MYCAICSNYLVQVNKLKRSSCSGCRVRGEKCTYLFEKCTGINHGVNISQSTPFCFECKQYPCRQLRRMDRRYRQNYGMSVVHNLDMIRDGGLEKFIESQDQKHRCKTCNGLISIHNQKCFNCDTITKLVDKQQ